MVELMIVISIIGILAVTLIPTITGAQAKARDTGRISSLTNAGTSMTSYSTDVGSYPIASNGCLTDVNGTIAGYIDKPSGSDVSTKLAKFFTNSKAALDPQKATITLADVCVIA